MIAGKDEKPGHRGFYPRNNPSCLTRALYPVPLKTRNGQKMRIVDKVKEKVYEPIQRLWCFVAAAFTMAAIALFIAVTK